MTFHAACARMLRAEAAAAGLHAPVHDLRPGRLAPAGQALPRRARGRPQALHARRAIQPQISDAKNKLRDAEAYAPDGRLLLRADRRRRLPLYERELHRMNAMDFDDLLVRAVNVLELFPEVRERYAHGFRHVLVDEYQDTNHAQYRWLQLLAGERPQPDGGRRRCPVDLRLPRRRHPQHPRLRGRLPRRPGRQARAELPLDADDPRRGQRGDRATTAGRSPRRCGPTSGRGIRSRCASSTTSTPRRASSPARSSGWSTRAPRARRSRSSTAPTRSRACWRTRSCARRSPTR